MVSVLFHLTDWQQYPGVDNPQSIMHQWIHNCKSLGVDRLIMIDSTTYHIGQYYNHVSSDILFKRYTTLDECINDNIGENFIFLEINDKSTCLTKFIHPESAICVVGPNHNSVVSSSEPYAWLLIPSNINYALYDHAAINITLYDRLLKTM